MPFQNWETLRHAAQTHVEPVIALAMQVCAVAAPTGDESRRAAFVAEQLRTRGYAPQIDDVGNVYARRGTHSARPVMLVLAHIDTVFPIETPLSVRREGAVLYGPGIGDNSLSVAAMLGVIDLFDQLGVETEADIVFAGNVGEEGLGNLRGARAAVERFRAQLDGVIVVDGDFGEICYAAVGSHRLRITVRGPGGHSFGDFGAPSAIHGLARAVAAVAEISVPQEPRTTLNVGVIRGGTSVNAIAQEADALIDLRSVDAQVLSDLVAQVHSRVAARVGDGLTVQYDVVGERPAGRLDAQLPLVQAATNVLRWLGVEAPHAHASSTDANIPISLGIPAVCIGVARGHGAHTREEHVDVSQLGDGLAQVARLLIEATVQVRR